MRGTSVSPALLLATASLVAAGCNKGPVSAARAEETPQDRAAAAEPGVDRADMFNELNAMDMLRDGRRIFRFDTFGDEAFWGGVLHLHEAIEGAAHGGVGPGVSPRTALAVGLKVDVDVLPKAVQDAIRKGQVDLDDPGVTLNLLGGDAVVGLTGFFNADGTLKSIGIQCALCHSTVDNSLAPGIGHRLDGWANRDLNVGAIVSLAPNLQPVADLLSLAGTPVDVATLKSVLATWGPGKFDAEVFLDGKALRPDGKAAATLLPPAFGLAGVNLHTWTGWGSVTHWNAFVANLEMHGQGTFVDARLNDPTRFPIAAKAGFFDVRPPDGKPDLVTSKLAALHFYQLSIPAPKPPEGFFDPAAAKRGEALFNGKAKCATCHVPPLYTEPGWNMHTPAELAIDDFQANRAPDQRYRTSPLKGLFTHIRGGPPSDRAEPGPFFHDGRFATLLDVVRHYNDAGVGNKMVPLGLTDAEMADLVQFLRSL
jgi:hypothetical protein